MELTGAEIIVRFLRDQGVRPGDVERIELRAQAENRFEFAVARSPPCADHSATRSQSDAAVDPVDVANDPLAFRPPTKFERRGRRLGHDVADLFYRRV